MAGFKPIVFRPNDKIAEDLEEEIHRIVKELGVSRSDAMRIIVRRGLGR